MTDKKIDGFLVKYALSMGIQPVKGAELSGDGYVSGPIGAHSRFFVKDGKNFVRTREEAEKVAREMAVRKIKSLEKQIAKLRVLAETPKWVEGKTA